MVILKESDQQAIRAHGEADFPYECCGLLIGHFSPDGSKVVEEVMSISNAREEEAKRNRFLITPEELMRGEQYARSKNWDVVGFYHSHPDHPATPSKFDLDHAWPMYSYLIVSVMAGTSIELTSWELDPDAGEFNQEDIATA